MRNQGLVHTVLLVSAMRVVSLVLPLLEPGEDRYEASGAYPQHGRDHFWGIASRVRWPAKRSGDRILGKPQAARLGTQVPPTLRSA